MEYIIILNYGYKNTEIVTDYNGFIQVFSSYEEAKFEAMDMMGSGWKNYEIFELCSKEINHKLKKNK